MKYVNVVKNGMTHIIPFSEVIQKYHYLFVCESKEAISFIEKFKDKNTEIKIHFTNKEEAKGIENGVGDWNTWKNWADVIVFCGNGFEEKCHQLEKKGYYCTTQKNIISLNLQENLSVFIYKKLENGWCDDGYVG